eukprot:CAMPEP_0185157946 /NCGR_PEP_ID=MMETSP1139-20130426/2099_1 /TAXON_ID=298111 /ORGANISM="Pavlova sp., Strain CCMP459" /LENGTH=72 /DNA_ID=CAMNT_0027723053 /DNA_START=540 /DNA_END=754 /DNA_ORIENTATION=-
MIGLDDPVAGVDFWNIPTAGRWRDCGRSRQRDIARVMWMTQELLVACFDHLVTSKQHVSSLSPDGRLAAKGL